MQNNAEINQTKYPDKHNALIDVGNIHRGGNYLHLFHIFTAADQSAATDGAYDNLITTDIATVPFINRLHCHFRPPV
jgi:hypothetical protein